MCGILGIAGSLADETSDDMFSNALDTLHDRGPDDKGQWRDNNILLGHRRLSILDLSDKAHQPMCSSDGRFTLVYNGEIYNFSEIRKQLASEGIKFRSTGDTEVLLKAMTHWGTKALNKLNGMFAFALFDKQQDELILARDRFGVKPLFYQTKSSNIIFASEIKALRKLSGGQKLNTSAAAIYFSIGYNYAPDTIWQDVHKLQAGHLLKWRNGKLHTQRWYRPYEIEHQTNCLDTAKEKLEAFLKDAVDIRMISDVPIGAFLSGGIDSSIVVGLMRKVTTGNIKTFTVAYNGLANYDESSYAASVAKRFSTEHTELEVESEEVKKIIPEVLDSWDEPFADPSALPTYLISREIRKHVTVALSGDGADEVFAGYRKYLGEYYINKWWGHFVYPLAKSIFSFLPSSRRNTFTEKVRRAKRFLSGMDHDPVKRHLNWMTVLQEDIVNSILPFDCGTSDQVGDKINSLYYQLDHQDKLNKVLYADQSIVLEGNMLPKVDLMSMQNSLEVRSPFMDYRVIRLANSMPSGFKSSAGKSKIILKDIFKDLLPPAILRRQKQGFDIPVGEWFRNEYKDVFWDVVMTTSGKKGINLKPVENLYRAHIAEKEDYSRALWAVFVWCWWWNRNF